MIQYYKNKLSEGCYIASHGRWESLSGSNYSPGSIGGISLMGKNGEYMQEVRPRDFNELLISSDLKALEWGDRGSHSGGGTEYRTKKWHYIEVNREAKGDNNAQ